MKRQNSLCWTLLWSASVALLRAATCPAPPCCPFPLSSPCSVIEANGERGEGPTSPPETKAPGNVASHFSQMPSNVPSDVTSTILQSSGPQPVSSTWREHRASVGIGSVSSSREMKYSGCLCCLNKGRTFQGQLWLIWGAAVVLSLAKETTKGTSSLLVSLDAQDYKEGLSLAHTWRRALES